MTSVYRCPICAQPLELQTNGWTCNFRHCFDKAKEGYVNLLPVQQKHTREPGDRIEMIRSRREFLERDFYAPLVENLLEVVAANLPIREAEVPLNVLDAGCGEGYYTGRLMEGLSQRWPEKPVGVWGIDISKPAIVLAARKYPRVGFSVASTFRLPIMTECLDCVVQIFAPGDPWEYHRALRSGGILVTATPGPEHLYGLKRLIYEQPRQYEPKEEDPPNFVLLDKRRILYRLHFDNSRDIANLLTMTPYSWHIKPDCLQRAGEAAELDTEVDFILSIYRSM